VKRLVVFILSLVMSPPLLFADETAFLFTPVSAAGSGGMHTAAEEGVYTLLGNPALLNSVSESMFFAVSAGIGDVYKDGAVKTSMPPAYYIVSGPLAIGSASKGVGYGLFNYIRLHDGGTDIHFIAASGFDWILINTAGVKLDLGLSPKLLFSFTGANAGILSAVGITPGVLLALGSKFSLGLSCSNIFSAAYLKDENSSEFALLSPLLNAGIAAGLVSNATLGLTLFADFRDILGLMAGETKEPLQAFACGARAEFWNNFYLSLGMAESAPTAGFGLNLGTIKVDMAFFANGAEVGIRIVRD
jgi:hypothetical protein